MGALGYTPWRVRENEIENGVSISQLHFLSDQQIVITFTSHVTPRSLSQRSQPDKSSGVQLNALFITTTTGQVRAKRKWPTSSERSRILPVGHGMFVIVTPDDLSQYSSLDQPLKNLSLPVGRKGIKTWWDAIPSPGGKYLMIWYDEAPDGDISKSALIETGTLRTVAPWAEGANGYIPLDNGDAVSGGGSAIGPLRGPSHPLRIPWSQGCKPSSLLMALNDSALFGETSVSIDRWCYSLALTTGQILFERELPAKEFVGLVGVSAGGQRFAIETCKVHGESWLLDIGGRALVYRIKVYDIPARRWIYALNGKKHGIRAISGLALSPDGSLLALINQEGILEVYRIAATRNSPR